jgi:hypothetical protein
MIRGGVMAATNRLSLTSSHPTTPASDRTAFALGAKQYVRVRETNEKTKKRSRTAEASGSILHLHGKLRNRLPTKAEEQRTAL